MLRFFLTVEKMLSLQIRNRKKISFLDSKKIASYRLLWRVFTDVVVEWIDKSSGIRIPYVILHQTTLIFIDSLYAYISETNHLSLCEAIFFELKNKILIIARGIMYTVYCEDE